MAVAAAALALGWAGPGAAHPGGLNAEGCHNNRKTGDYHCHRAPRPAEGRESSRPQGVLGAGGGAFRNCAAARAAGAAPLRRGQPGYGPHLDRDNDGVACE
ncbi:excalibur calcium-binding domain-containing protein [Phenylobacterium sp.]|uniref:excalibur calcium-binding domain-containing protein n=1 Tax=Phenylobacterium sp. TaxID=1871053 RepID=UPI0035B4D344